MFIHEQNLASISVSSCLAAGEYRTTQRCLVVWMLPLRLDGSGQPLGTVLQPEINPGTGANSNSNLFVCNAGENHA